MPFIPGMIGLLCCASGAGLLYGASRNRRFLLARRWAQIGIGVWILWLFLARLAVQPQPVPWEFRFFTYFIGTVILLQICCHVLIGAGQALGGSWNSYYSKRAAVFSGGYAAVVIVVMWNDLLRFGVFETENLFVSIPGLLLLAFAIWMMRTMALLRRRYSILEE